MSHPIVLILIVTFAVEAVIYARHAMGVQS